jgi:uncharacterized protein (TIGR03437 family)
MRHIWLFLELSLISTLAVASPNQVVARYVDIGDQGQSQFLTADGSGNLFVVSQIIEPSGRMAIRATKTDPQGNTLASFDLPESVSANPIGAATDPQGNLVVAGNLVFSGNFVVKINSQLDQVLFSTQVSGVIFLQALAVDSIGTIFVVGNTTGVNFTITGNPSHSAPPQSNGQSNYAFITEFSPDGSNITFSTYFGSDQGNCTPVSCSAQTVATNVVIDSDGSIVVAGRSDSTNLPVTPGAYAEQCGCVSGLPAGFVAKFAPGGSSLEWATYIPVTGSIDQGFAISSVAFAADGGLLVGGQGGNWGPVATPGAVQSSPPEGLTSGFVLKLDSTGDRLVFSTEIGGYVGGIGLNGVTSVASDPQGNIWITGGSIPSLLPVPSGTPLLGGTYTAALSADGSSVTSAFTAPLGAAGQAVTVTQTGAVVTLGANGSLIIGVPENGPSIIGVGNSASLSVSGYVAPDELISLYGVGLGPATPMNAQVVNGNVTTSLGGVQVLFDGGAVPLLYAGPNQINALVPPFGEGQDSTVLQIVTPGGTTPGTTLHLRPSQPEVFCSSMPDSGGVYSALALNQDGSLNSANNPAAPDSIVTVWATGAGEPGGIAPGFGSIVSTLLSVPALPVSVLMSTGTDNNLFFGFGDSLEVLYAGDSPGMVTGMIQINFRIPSKPYFDPATFTDGPEVVCAIQVGEELSALFGIYVH